jgi:gliding motility-associated-like protein
MQIEEPGLLGITIEHEDGYDVDFACYGPFEAASKQELIDKINGDSSVFVFHDGYSFNSMYAPDDSICYPQSYLDALDRMVFIEDSIYALCIEDLFLRDISEFNDYDEYQEYWDEESEKESKCLQEKYEECNVVYPPDPVQFDINNPCFRGYYDDFPYDKMADCSYSPSSKEFCYLPDAKAGEWYLLLITNFESKPGTISFKQTAGTATNNCKIIVDAMLLEPACEGGPIKLDVNNAPENATFSWIGPNGFSSTERNPIIYNATQENAGVYTLVMVGSNGIASGEVEVPVVVHEKQTENVIESIQMGETFMFGDEELTAPGTYQKTFVSELTGCDSTVNLTLELSEQNVVIGFNVPCEGEDLSFEVVAGVPENIACLWTGPNGFSSTERNPVIHNVTQDHAGTYSFSITSSGFDVPSIDADIEVSPIQRTELTDSIYPGDTYLFNGTPLSAAGTYYDTLSCALTGCDSIVTLKLAMKGYDPILLSNNGPLCEGETLSFEVTTNTPADASFSWTGPDGFSSSEAQPTLPNVTEAQSGTYSLTITANGVALSTAETDVVVNPTLRTELTDSIYPGDTYLFNGTSLSAAGTYHDTLSSVLTGCDSIVTLKLTMRGYDPILLSNNGPLCEGGTLSFGVTTNAPADASFSWTGPDGFSSSETQPTLPNVTEAQSGTYSLTITANGVALSTSETDVVVNPTLRTELTDSIYPGDTYLFNGTSLSAAGTYYDTLSSVLTGCDSIVTLKLTMRGYDPVLLTNNGPLCEGETLSFGVTTNAPADASFSWTGPDGFSSSEAQPTLPNVTEAQSGTYSLTITANGIALSTVETDVVVNLSKHTELTDFIYSGEVYPFNGTSISAAGTYHDTLASALTGCDSIVTLVLTVEDSAVISNNGPLCEGETLILNLDEAPNGVALKWEGPNAFASTEQNPSIEDVTILNAGLYSVEYEYSGRSFRLTTPVVVNKTKTATVKAIIKGDETYRVGDEEYTESGEYNASLVSSIGCDSIVHLTLVKINTIELLPDEVFTPNSDGIRDRWTIKNVESYAQLDVTIYDRTGKIVRVFNAYDNLENSWDGKDDRGNDLPSSDYWYVINVAESDVQYVGHVSLSR